LVTKCCSTRAESRPRRLLALALGFAAACTAAEPAGIPRVGDDATLSLDGQEFRLAGILVPQAAADCAAFALPPGCGAPAAPALRAKAQGLVRCTSVEDDPRLARCLLDEPGWATGLDLAAWLVEQGWARALDDAPFEYHVLERLARQTGRGLWQGAGGALAPGFAAPGAPD
jgi:endonuclease YncB( thermonuclease family)